MEERQTVRRAFARLPEREQEVIRLRFGAGLTQAQIASQVGVSQMSISRVLGRTLRLMRTQFSPPITAGQDARPRLVLSPPQEAGRTDGR